MELSQEQQQLAEERPLRDDVLEIVATYFGHQPDSGKVADGVMQLLNERGHIIPGMPPAGQILADARDFAERLTIVTLALRLLNMLAYLTVATPETRPAKRWLDDYLEGRNHGPAGKPMLWPHQLPGIASMLRDWGFMPTPSKPAYVTKAPPVTVLDAAPVRVR